MARPTDRVRLYSALEAAKLCGVVNQTTINWIRAGHLKAFLTPGGQYRIYADDLARFLQSRAMRVPEELTGLTGENEPDWSCLLIVDDDRSLNTMLARVIAHRFPQITVCQAFDGFEAGRLISSARPGTVILDLNLPGVDGRAICHQIKTDASFGNPYVIAITGMDAEEYRPIMLSEGADAFFAKPFIMDELMTSLGQFIRSGAEPTPATAAALR